MAFFFEFERGRLTLLDRETDIPAQSLLFPLFSGKLQRFGYAAAWPERELAPPTPTHLSERLRVFFCVLFFHGHLRKAWSAPGASGLTIVAADSSQQSTHSS